MPVPKTTARADRKTSPESDAYRKTGLTEGGGDQTGDTGENQREDNTAVLMGRDIDRRHGTFLAHPPKKSRFKIFPRDETF